MSDTTSARKGLTFGGFRVLVLIANNQYEPTECNETQLHRIVDAGLVRSSADKPHAYELTTLGRQVLQEHQRGWERVRAEVSASLATLTSAVDATLRQQLTDTFAIASKINDVTAAYSSVPQQILAGTEAATSLGSVAERFQALDLHQETLASAMRSLYPAQSILEAASAAMVPVDNILATVGHLSATNSYLSDLVRPANEATAYLAEVGKNLDYSIIDIAKLGQVAQVPNLWSGYLAELSSFSGAVERMVTGLNVSDLIAPVGSANLTVIGHAARTASIPPVYDLAQQRVGGSAVVDELTSVTFSDQQISERMAQLGAAYGKLWSAIEFAMDARNPGRVKQVVYTARELIQTYLDEFAPSQAVKAHLHKDIVTRRERIAFLVDPNTREETIWVLDHLDHLVASLDATMSAIGHEKSEQDRDEVNLTAFVGLVANAVVLLDNNRRR